jgi:hypothetical protein
MGSLGYLYPVKLYSHTVFGFHRNIMPRLGVASSPGNSWDFVLMGKVYGRMYFFGRWDGSFSLLCFHLFINSQEEKIYSLQSNIFFPTVVLLSGEPTRRDARN